MSIFSDNLTIMYQWPGFVESLHRYFETLPFSKQHILFGYTNIFECYHSRVGCPLSHIQFLAKHGKPINTISKNCSRHDKRLTLVITLRPGVKPSLSRSTIKAVKALLAGAFGSGFVLARTKYLHNGLLLSQKYGNIRFSLYYKR